jgi:hypothetical protein
MIYLKGTIERGTILPPALRWRSRQNPGPRGLVVDDLFCRSD